ncbi:MAG TPA: acetyl xylan esterase, partial [Candidatus Binatia bacterium]|nr:acetyl xylan esterase [Candidatus Binatia bacterium]
MNHLYVLVAFGLSFAWFASASEQGRLPESDTRAREVRTLDTRREFPEIASKATWEARAREIREQALVSCGLWPMPEKTPLNAKIFDRAERDGYSIEKVYIQTLPGFYLAGNLYRPLGKKGPFPGVLNPHGHWKEGRMANAPLGSIAARCINFARQGMVAFSYDMVGYNDTAQVNHKFASDPTNLLWNISLMGLQTWNSIRALDFLESLPDVDKSRLACTGESGGGTQTFMLGAVDSRLHVQAPIVMVSHSMQGGCLCENAPGLRVDYSNMEIAAVPAPRPQILVAATGDWTKMTMTVEGPAIERIYKLFNAADKLRYTIFDFDHNYNQTSREAVYGWFGKWLLNKPEADAVKETAYEMEPVESLRVFPDGKLPEDALTEPQLIAYLIDRSRTQFNSLCPRDSAGLEKFKATMLPAWKHTLQVEFPERNLVVEPGESKKVGGVTKYSLVIGRRDRGDRVPVSMLTPAKDNLRTVTILVSPDGKSAFLDNEGSPRGIAKELLARNQSVILLDTFLTGELASPEVAQKRKQTTTHFTTYNRTDLQERVQDLITACAFAQSHGKGRRVVLCGSGRAGLWALLAAPAADAVVADCAGSDAQS